MIVEKHGVKCVYIYICVCVCVRVYVYVCICEHIYIRDWVGNR